MKRLLFMLYSLAFVLLATPTFAQVLPALSLERLAVGAGMNYVGRFDAGTEPLPQPDHEWEAGLYGAYVLVPRLAAVGSVERGFDLKRWEFLPGVNLRLTQPDAPIAFGLKAAYRIYSAEEGDPPTFGKEWVVGLTAAKALQPWLLVAGSLDYGLDNQQAKLAAGIRVAHSFAKGGF